MIALSHARVSLALHTLREADGPPLLLLHALGGSALEWGMLPWWGPVYALDLCGHGHSGWATAAARAEAASFAAECHDLALATVTTYDPHTSVV
jgi:pimeloyl-ACP methyl ester carboxylesterase